MQMWGAARHLFTHTHTRTHMPILVVEETSSCIIRHSYRKNRRHGRDLLILCLINHISRIIAGTRQLISGRDKPPQIRVPGI